MHYEYQAGTIPFRFFFWENYVITWKNTRNFFILGSIILYCIIYLRFMSAF